MITPKEQQEQRVILNTAHNDFEKGMHRHAFFKVSNHATGEDLVQETFMKTWVYLAKGGKVHIMKAFLYHILNNLIIDEYRKHKTTSLDSLIEKGFDPRETESEKLLGVLDGKSALLLIARLPEKYQKVLRMRYVQDLTLEEMSIITGQSKKTLSVQVFRGVEKLRALYKEN